MKVLIIDPQDYFYNEIVDVSYERFDDNRDKQHIYALDETGKNEMIWKIRGQLPTA